MARKRDSFYINSEGGNYEALKRGIQWLIKQCEKDGNQNAFLCVPTKQNLTGVISDTLGKDYTNILSKNNEARLPNNLGKLILITERSKNVNNSGPCLVLYPSSKLLNKIDSYTELRKVLVIPWGWNSNIQNWIKTWNAKELETNDKKNAEQFIKNPVVDEALRDLLESINTSTGIS
ncbi:hypothetical protein [Halobacillus sp. Marseille-Q1614]|uniref:hypothetical protein n=1 Tax=Halobacillus sp. Marseille-Q1614 TaxID=2709134 RepID=UPI00156F9255|nr:hypothetical protein [Halobacillus sp. Marseille-Q1614]